MLEQLFRNNLHFAPARAARGHAARRSAPTHWFEHSRKEASSILQGTHVNVEGLLASDHVHCSGLRLLHGRLQELHCKILKGHQLFTNQSPACEKSEQDSQEQQWRCLRRAGLWILCLCRSAVLCPAARYETALEMSSNYCRRWGSKGKVGPFEEDHHCRLRRAVALPQPRTLLQQGNKSQPTCADSGKGPAEHTQPRLSSQASSMKAS